MQHYYDTFLGSYDFFSVFGQSFEKNWKIDGAQIRRAPTERDMVSEIYFSRIVVWLHVNRFNFPNKLTDSAFEANKIVIYVEFSKWKGFRISF